MSVFLCDECNRARAGLALTESILCVKVIVPDLPSQITLYVCSESERRAFTYRLDAVARVESWQERDSEEWMILKEENQ